MAGYPRLAASRRRFLTVLAGASASLAAPSPAVGQNNAQNRTSVKIATGVTPPSIHNIWLHVAHERGFFRDNGIAVAEFMQLRGGPLALQAIASRQVDIAPADPEGLLAATLAGHAIRGVAAPGAHLSYIVAVRKELNTIADLRGKSFAISRPGAISQYLMFPLLERAGVPGDSVRWLGVGGGYERMLALLAGRVQGALLNVDFAMQAVDDPNIKLIQPVADILPNYPVELVVLRKDLLDQNPSRGNGDYARGDPGLPLHRFEQGGHDRGRAQVHAGHECRGVDPRLRRAPADSRIRRERRHDDCEPDRRS